MTSEREERISGIFTSAREFTGDERAAFLAEACTGDEELLLEVEELLAAEARAGDFLKQPLSALAADLFTASPAVSSSSFGEALPTERLLGRYRVLSRLGAGGMGEVFLAEDTQLDRRVAVKLLSAEFTSDSERVRRFVREAKAASALNHPNILTVHEIGEIQTDAGKLHCIVTEYVDGQTLRARMSAGKMPPDAVIEVAIQVAGALAVAHEAGIIHRDIKPENLMLRGDGYVKLLDFGLAKLTGPTSGERLAKVADDQLDQPSPADSHSTAPGIVMGTAHYMSPEQARGLSMDARTDIFSLGVVIYEMVAGRTPFAGVNAIEVMGAIINQEPAALGKDLAAYQPMASELEHIVAKALCKDRGERYQASSELLLDLRSLKGDLEAHTGVSSSGGKRIPAERSRQKLRSARWLVPILLTATAAIGALAWYLTDRSPTRVSERPNIVPFASLPGLESEPEFSPDGNQLVFSWDGGAGGQTDIYVKLIGVGTPLRLTSDPANESSPAWSPDGRFIAFVRAGPPETSLLILPALGGPERKVFTSSNFIYDLDWSPDGKWLALKEDTDAVPGITLVSLETGEKRLLTKPVASSFDQKPAFSLDGRQLAFVRDNGKVYLTSVIDGGEKMLAGNLGVISGLAWSEDGGEIIFDSALIGNWTLWRIPSAGGRPEAIFSEGAKYSTPIISRRGHRLAVVERQYDTDIRRLELPRVAPTSGGVEIKQEAMTKLITSQREDNSPQFSPDGKKIAFASDRSGSMEIWVCASDGSNPLQLTHVGVASSGSPRWSPDSRRLVYDSNLETHSDLFMIDAEGGAPRRLTTDPASDLLPTWSRDGAWIYFCSDRGGNRGDRQIWKMPAEGGPAVQLTRKGGFEAVEAPDGKTIYYSKGYTDGLWSVPSTGGDERPVPELSEAGYWRAWTITSDGIYFVAHVGPAAPRPFKFLSFATRRTIQIGMVEKDPLRWVPGLAISPNGRWLLFAQVERNTSNIMLIENFR